MDTKLAIDYIKTEYRRLDALTGLDSSAVEIGISGRYSRRLGCFNVYRERFGKKSFKIIVSKKALSDPELFYDVIRHEYAHFAVYKLYPGERHNHDEQWKAVCRLIGCTPKATINMKSAEARPYKYQVVCKCCGAGGRYRSKGKAVKIAMGELSGTLKCTKCGGNDFMVRFL